MARKCNLRRKIDRSIKRRKSMEERKAYRKKLEEAEQRAKENKEMKMKEKNLELWNSHTQIRFKKYQV